MVCCSCVFKLAKRLVENHRIDWITALRRASKGIERYENNREKPKIYGGKGNPSDYSQNCQLNPAGTCTCRESGVFRCTKDDNCYIPPQNCCECPDPLPHSHYISDSCGPVMDGCYCMQEMPWEPYYCWDVGCECVGCTGVCWYDCDEGYEWNGEACVPIVVPKAGLHPSKVVPLIISD